MNVDKYNYNCDNLMSSRMISCASTPNALERKERLIVTIYFIIDKTRCAETRHFSAPHRDAQ